MGFGSFGGAAAGVLATGLVVFFSFGLIAIFVIVVIANRADPDPSGKRPMTAYLFSAAFVTLFAAISGILAAIFTLVAYIGHTGNGGYGFSFEQHPARDATIRGVTLGLLLLVVAGAAHYFHHLRGMQLAASEPDASAPAKRVERSYVAVVSFISIVVLVLTTFYALYTIVQIIAPGVYQLSSRTAGWKALLDELAVIVVFAGVFIVHQSETRTGWRLLPERKSAPAHAPSAPGEGGPTSA
jgi:hypothetical protein